MDASDNTSTIIWGAAAIAATIGQTERATFHMLEKGELPARRVGRRWAADRETLLTFFRGENASAAR